MGKYRTYRNFIMSGTTASSGLYYRLSPLNREKNGLKNSFNTDLTREMGKAKETEDMGDV